MKLSVKSEHSLIKFFFTKLPNKSIFNYCFKTYIQNFFFFSRKLVGREKIARQRAVWSNKNLPPLHSRYLISDDTPRERFAKGCKCSGAQYIRQSIPQARSHQGNKTEDESREEKL